MHDFILITPTILSRSLARKVMPGKLENNSIFLGTPRALEVSTYLFWGVYRTFYLAILELRAYFLRVYQKWYVRKAPRLIASLS